MADSINTDGYIMMLKGHCVYDTNGIFGILALLIGISRAGL